jgi:hypothetical protein
MDIRNSKGRNGFWEAYRACAEENRVASIHLSGASSPGFLAIEHYQKRIEASRYSNICVWNFAALPMLLGTAYSVVSGLTAVGNCSENLPSPLFAKEG